MANHKVTLHQYDLSQGMAKEYSGMLLGQQFDGVWHTGICVYGKEFFFGGGMCWDGVGRTPFGKPDKTVLLGMTRTQEPAFLDHLKKNLKEFCEDAYDIVNNNCNHFTNFATQFLLNKGIPEDVMGQSKYLSDSPFATMILPVMKKA